MASAGEHFEVVVARLDASRDEVRALQACLSALERQRAERFRFERERRRFVVARARLRELLAARLCTRAEAVEIEHGANGKPRLARGELQFSVSHCEDLALFAFSRACRVGIDVEAVRAIPEADAIAAQFFSWREYTAYSTLAPEDKPLGFLRCWTRREAASKALGGGLSMPLVAFAVSRLHNFSPLPGFIAAVACHHG